MIEFKKALEAQDFELIENLADVIWRAHYIPIVGKPQIDYMLAEFQSASAIEKQIQEGFTYYIITFEKEAIGYLSIKNENPYLFLSKIYILKNFRGQQIGKKAIEFAQKRALAFNLKRLRLTVNVNNALSISFYQKLGFINNGPLITDIGKGFIMDDYEMIKIL